MTTVRKALANETPHVSTKTAWRLVIQRARNQADQGPLRKRSAVDAMLDTELTAGMDIGLLKRALYGCVHGGSPAEKSEAFSAVEAWYLRHVPPVFNGPIAISVEVRGAGHTLHGVDEWLGTNNGSIVLDVFKAVRLKHHLDNRSVAGGQVRVVLGDANGHRLPTIKRGQRSRKPTRNHRSWLPYTDREGQFSASPRSIAELHASLLGNRDVIYDPFCGAGADAIGFALEGKRVFASDTDDNRLNLARQNARRLGVQDSIEFTQQPAAEVLSKIVPDYRTGVFLDPPWGGPGGALDVDAALSLVDAIPTALEVVLKAPRKFSVARFRTAGCRWNVHLGLDVEMVDPVDRLKTLALHRIPIT